MDVITYALLKKKIAGIAPGYSYKGSVATAADLPEEAETGDLYTVTGEGNLQYVWDGEDWIAIKSQSEAGLVGYDGTKSYGSGTVGKEIGDLKSALKSGAEEDAEYHLGFYLDENGDLCQVDDE